jgi:hypothetical protein
MLPQNFSDKQLWLPNGVYIQMVIYVTLIKIYYQYIHE